MTFTGQWWRWTTGGAVVVAVALVLHQWAAFRTAVSAFDLVPFDNDALGERHQTESPNAHTFDQVVAVPTALLENSGPSFTSDLPSVHDHVAAGRDYLARHPNFRRHLAAHLRGRIRERYETLLDSLHLTPAEAGAFEDVQLARMWINVTGPEGPLGFCVASPASQEQIDQELTDVLGEERFHAYQNFERRIGVHFAAHQLVMGLYFTDEPLTSDQRELVVEVLAESSGAFRNGRNASRFSVDWEEARTRAATILSPSQRAVLERIACREEYVQVREAGMAVRLPSPSETRTPQDTVFPAGL